jgi:hypothetical protein
VAILVQVVSAEYVTISSHYMATVFNSDAGATAGVLITLAME